MRKGAHLDSIKKKRFKIDTKINFYGALVQENQTTQLKESVTQQCIVWLMLLETKIKPSLKSLKNCEQNILYFKNSYFKEKRTVYL
jgi:hypothetical protein